MSDDPKVRRPDPAEKAMMVDGAQAIQTLMEERGTEPGDAVNVALFFVAHMFHDGGEGPHQPSIAAITRHYLREMERALGERAVTVRTFGPAISPNGPPPVIVELELDQQIDAIKRLFQEGPTAVTNDKIAAVLATVVEALGSQLHGKITKLTPLEGKQ